MSGRRRLGTPRLHLRLTDSTNARARELAAAGAAHGTLVTATEQSAGHGRQGRSWWAPAGEALLMSLVLRRAERSLELLPLLSAVAVCDAVGPPALVKWPNDVVVEPVPGRLAKLAGILVEGRPQEGWAVVGVGLNVAVDVDAAPEELRPRLASLGRPRSAIEPLLEALLAALEERLAEPEASVLECWRALDVLRGRDVSWSVHPSSASGGAEQLRGTDGAERGVAAGIDGAGRLVVTRPDGGRSTLASGEVHLAAGG